MREEGGGGREKKEKKIRSRRKKTRNRGMSMKEKIRRIGKDGEESEEGEGKKRAKKRCVEALLTVHVPDDVLDAVVPGVSHFAARDGRGRQKQGKKERGKNGVIIHRTWSPELYGERDKLKRTNI